jgi:hypothetical protein
LFKGRRGKAKLCLYHQNGVEKEKKERKGRREVAEEGK